MSNFLTVEDVNSILLKYGDVPTLHTIDTSKVGNQEFDSIMYDFCIMSHTINGNNHTFTFNIRNSLWCGGYYFTKTNGDYLDVDASYSNGIITLTTTEESVCLILYLTNLYNTFNFERLTWKSDDLKNLNLFYHAMNEETFTITMLDGSTPTGQVLFSFMTFSATSTIQEGIVEYALEDDDVYFNGVVKVTYDGCSYYIKPKFIKDVAPVIVNGSVVATKVNTVELSVPVAFQNLQTGTVYYNNKEIPVDFNEDYSFELDLTEKVDKKPVKFKLVVDETYATLEHSYDFVIPCVFNEVSSFEELYLELNSPGGSRVLELTGDIEFTSDIRITHDTKIIGGDFEFNLNEHSLILNEGVNLKANNIIFNVGDPAIIQEINSKLDADNCTFTNCAATNYNHLGSAILCDINLESMNVDDDFITNLTGCTFTNNHSCILHGGTLYIDNCNYLNNNTDYINKNNAAFLHQTDGEAIIQNSVFDIDYPTNILCSQQQNIGFAQALFKCGLNAQINRATHEYLNKDNNIIFFDNPYNNRAHIFAKYYYPKIESCVYSSPLPGKEDKSLCYCISGVNWVFKENVQVTRADAENENTLRKIEW